MKKLLIAIALILTTSHTSHAEILFNAQEQPTFMGGLEVAGVQYNVSFQYGGSFDSIYGDFMAPSPTPTFWGDPTGASAAVAAMADALNLAGQFPTVNTTLVVSVESGSGFFGDVVDAAFSGFNPGDVQYSSDPFDLAGVSLDPHSESNVGWPTFVTVPEPTAGMLGLLCLGMFFVTAGRKRADTLVRHMPERG